MGNMLAERFQRSPNACSVLDVIFQKNVAGSIEMMVLCSSDIGLAIKPDHGLFQQLKCQHCPGDGLGLLNML
ncbi:hypothetical protein EGJ64_13640 [Pseudomonas aeruginosa]|nr:hypothetical protein EGJ64_13640 [Pseudomonas aeruginosa]RRW83970.1 hypothetical protein EGJ69_31200 [Pseudomonas aeruginosa]RRX14338.1 hypothetical protein EGJ84_30165 [Pseudomonas aeruginosa]RRX32521.1 hypothetical protein EGJ75_29870 [Pseudomonas aeruginosa]RRY50808.1 hypothetical protein EGJ92_22905 [Pseudomonas aeruginosa]